MGVEEDTLLDVLHLPWLAVFTSQQLAHLRQSDTIDDYKSLLNQVDLRYRLSVYLEVKAGLFQLLRQSDAKGKHKERWTRVTSSTRMGWIITSACGCLPQQTALRIIRRAT